MNRIEHLLVCLNEECLEVAHRVDKALRFGTLEVQPGQVFTNGDRIVDEFLQALAVMEMLSGAGELNFQPNSPFSLSVIDAKKRKVERNMYLKNCPPFLSGTDRSKGDTTC